MWTLIQAFIVPIAAALLVGLVTARWAFRRPDPSAASTEDKNAA